MIAGETTRDRIRNKDIREEYGIEDAVRIAGERGTQWNGHVKRTEESRLIRIARDQRPMGRGDPGRPLKTWKESSISAETP
ncbi:hypothetical protein Trydic_g15822 [Trypoxylus dichotomus]